MKKNDFVTLEITGLTREGNGVGRAGGVVVFVPYTAVGDVISCKIVKAKKSYCYGITDKLLTPSESRLSENEVLSGCGLYKKCGGCAFRHISYEAELEAKESFVREAFCRIGADAERDFPLPEFEPIAGSNRIDRYRNKAQLRAAADKDGRLYLGYYAKRSHRTAKVDDCALLPEIFGEICADVTRFANENAVTAYDEQTGKGLLRHIFLRRGERSGEIMICFIVTSIKSGGIFGALADMLCEKYPDVKSVLLNENEKKTNVILGSKTKLLRGREVIYDVMCGNRIGLSLHSFYQINTSQAERVYEIAAEYAGLTGKETLLDLYCGAGAIGLSMARRVKKLIGVEIVAQAVENAKENAAVNGIENARFICADAGEAAKLLYESGCVPDVITLDPARSGCTPDTLGYIVKMQPKRIVMISCDPATAARDCKILSSFGYYMRRARAADIFPRTGHVETVVMLSRK